MLFAKRVPTLPEGGTSYFADQAGAELRRRGIERAKEVCAIQDGAEWIQGFVHGHRHDALRILDFAHAASYVYEIADKVREGEDMYQPGGWMLSCTGSSMRGPRGCCATSRARPVNSSAFVSSRPNDRRRIRLPCPFRRHRSHHARRPGAQRLSIAGGGRPFPLACSSKQAAQKNETHPSF